MRHSRLMLFCALLALATLACTLNSSGDAVPQPNAQPDVDSTTEDAGLPTAPADDGALAFNLTLTDGIDAMMTPGTADSVLIPAQDVPADELGNPAVSVPATVNVTFQQGTPENGIAVLLYISPEIDAGTYTIGDADDDAPVYAVVQQIAPVEGGLSARQFDQNLSGALTLTEAGDQISGSLSFSAGGQNGTVTVTGTFSNVPFTRP